MSTSTNAPPIGSLCARITKSLTYIVGLAEEPHLQKVLLPLLFERL